MPSFILNMGPVNPCIIKYNDNDFIIHGNKYWINGFKNRLVIYLYKDERLEFDVISDMNIAINIEYFLIETSPIYKQGLNIVQVKYFEQQVEKLLKLKAFI